MKFTVIYPEKVQEIMNPQKLILENNYELISCFSIPESIWWNNYYHPLQEKISLLWKKHQNNNKIQKIF